LVAKNASTKNAEVTTIATAFTHQARREDSPRRQQQHGEHDIGG